jgi:signal transduction histidine kinase
MTTIHWLGAFLRFLPGLVWAVMARTTWAFLLTRRPRSPLFRIFPVLSTLVATNFLLGAFIWLLPDGWIDWQGNRTPSLGLVLVFILSDNCSIFSMPLLRHAACYLGLREQPPSRLWLSVNYGSAVLMSAVGFILFQLPGSSHAMQLKVYRLTYFGYQLVMLTLALGQLGRIAQRGGWRPGTMVMRYRDVAAIAGGCFVLAGLLLLVAWDRQDSLLLWLTLDVLMGFAVTVPIAMRFLGEIIRVVLMTAMIFVVTLLAHFALDALSAGRDLGDFRRVLDVLAAFAVTLTVLAFQPGLRSAIDRLVFRRRHSRRDELQAFLQNLSPELGTSECARRALDELVRVMEFGGAALLLDDGTAIASGPIALDRIEAAWPQGASRDLLPVCPLSAYTVSDLPLPLREVLVDADVVAVLPIASPRHRRGHLLAAAGRLTVAYDEEDQQLIDSFVAQLVLVLESAELLERTVAVERSLAHAEKLAAIGELAARIAHEIRNPVTAARSLAQQLSDDATSPLNVEHAHLILTELERVERQIASLLRYARRETFRFEPVDLGDLARSTLESFRPRLEAAEIAAAVVAPEGVTARADREKLRQVLINLIENSLDALRERDGGRRLELTVVQVNGSSRLHVSDNGPGVPAEALNRLFEPFFSLKPTGTGLGLAIARRTVEEHGGQIEALPSTESGITFAIDLPNAEER